MAGKRVYVTIALLLLPITINLPGADMTQIHQLYELQKLDTEIDEKKKRLGRVLKAQNEPEALQAMRERAETAVATLKTWQTTHKALADEVSSVAAKAQDSEARLYSGKVTNPKELADLQQEVESLGRRKETLEAEVLEASVMVEEAQKEETAATTEMETAVGDWEKQSSNLKAEQNKLALNLHKLMQTRQTKAKNIDAALLKEYKQLRSKQKNGVAVAGLRVNMCLGCRTSVSASKAKAVNEGQKAYCGGCGRLLAAL